MKVKEVVVVVSIAQVAADVIRSRVYETAKQLFFLQSRVVV